jgi:hypothetical protein
MRDPVEPPPDPPSCATGIERHDAPARTPIPYAGRTVIALDAAHFDTIRQTVAALSRIAHTPAYAAMVDAGAPELPRRVPGNTGVFMGYDFHVTPSGPRLIEVNTNAGGALVNGLHTAALCNPVALECLCRELVSVDAMERRIVRMFETEHRAARGEDARLAHVAIVDEHPASQLLYPEFELVAELLRRAGIEVTIADTAELKRAADGRVTLRGQPIDLVYLRDTDFTLDAPRSRVLRAAYMAGEVVVSPAPREHHLLANKARLVLFSSPAALAGLGASPEESALLQRIVPPTVPLAEVGLERAWCERRGLVFKPAAAYGGKAVYRGDKISRRRLDEIAAEGGFLAQERVEPGLVRVETTDGPREMKFDVRAYAYRDEVLLLGARVYSGQVTNMRSAGGGFSAICVSRGGAGVAPADLRCGP